MLAIGGAPAFIMAVLAVSIAVPMGVAAMFPITVGVFGMSVLVMVPVVAIPVVAILVVTIPVVTIVVVPIVVVPIVVVAVAHMPILAMRVGGFAA